MVDNRPKALITHVNGSLKESMLDAWNVSWGAVDMTKCAKSRLNQLHLSGDW